MWKSNKNNLIKNIISIKNNQCGFSLIELSIAIIILGVALLPISQAFPYSTAIITASKMATISSYLAQEKIEEVYSLGYSLSGIGTIETRQIVLGIIERETIIEYMDENLQVSVSDTGLKKITTTVYYYNNVTKSVKSYTINTLQVNK